MAGTTRNAKGLWPWLIILIGAVVVAIIALAIDKTRGGITADNGLLLAVIAAIFAGGSQLFHRIEAVRDRTERDREERIMADAELTASIRSYEVRCDKLRAVCLEGQRQMMADMHDQLTANKTLLESNNGLLQQLLDHILGEKG